MSTTIPNKLLVTTRISELDSSIESQIAWYHQMQETQPILYHPEYNLWEVFRYKDVQQVLSDSATFSSDHCQPEALPFAFAPSDPPRHHQLRALVSRAFSPSHIEKLRPRFIQIVDELLEPAITNGKVNAVTEFTSLLPMHASAEILGVPLVGQERFLQWTLQLTIHQLGVAIPDHTEIFQYFSDLLDERKRNPGDDLISALLAAEENGARLTREEILHMCLEMMFAGNPPTTNMLNSVLYRFCQHPEIYQTLRNDPSLIPGAIEETVRYDFSSFGMRRTARHDTVLGGHEIKAGQYVVAWTSAAGFDEAYFPHSEQFDIRRSPNPHLNFSYGIHYCLGAALARLEGRIALERIIAHFSEIRFDPGSPVQYAGELRVIESLGILLTKGSSTLEDGMLRS